MKSVIVRLDQIMSILLTTNKHRLQSLLQSLLLRFALHIPSIIQLNLDYIIIDFRKLLKIFWSVICQIQANQSILLTFKNQPRNASKKFFGCSIQRKTCQFQKRPRRWRILFLKGLSNRFWLTLKSCLWLNKVLHDRPSIKWTLYKCIDILPKVDQMQSLFRKYFFIILDLVPPRNQKFGLLPMRKSLYKKILWCQSEGLLV